MPIYRHKNNRIKAQVQPEITVTVAVRNRGLPERVFQDSLAVV